MIFLKGIGEFENRLSSLEGLAAQGALRKQSEM